MPELNINWDDIVNADIPQGLVDSVRKLIESGSVLEINPTDVSTNTNESIEKVKKLFGILVKGGLIKKKRRFFCPFVGEVCLKKKLI